MHTQPNLKVSGPLGDSAYKTALTTCVAEDAGRGCEPDFCACIRTAPPSLPGGHKTSLCPYITPKKRYNMPLVSDFKVPKGWLKAQPQLGREVCNCHICPPEAQENSRKKHGPRFQGPYRPTWKTHPRIRRGLLFLAQMLCVAFASLQGLRQALKTVCRVGEGVARTPE